jgi:hypothetical protein
MHEAPLYSAFLVSVQALELVAASPKQGAYFESTVVRRRAESTSAAYEKTSSGYSSLPKALEREREREGGDKASQSRFQCRCSVDKRKLFSRYLPVRFPFPRRLLENRTTRLVTEKGLIISLPNSTFSNLFLFLIWDMG